MADVGGSFSLSRTEERRFSGPDRHVNLTSRGLTQDDAVPLDAGNGARSDGVARGDDRATDDRQAVGSGNHDAIDGGQWEPGG